MFKFYYLLILTSLIIVVNCQSTSNLVTSLPDIGTLKTVTYSGLLLSNSKYSSYLYYIFMQSLNNASTDPLILWLQGGPGSSSLFGCFVENGLYQIASNGSWSTNKYSWLTNASILWIDNPVGAGYSHTNGGYEHNEKTLSLDLATALQQFMLLHPSFSQNLFYIFGESYAGKYVSWLAYTILTNSTLHINGIGLGNAWVSPTWQTGSNAAYLYKNNKINMQQLLAYSIEMSTFNSLLQSKDFIKANSLDQAMFSVLCLQGNIDNYFNINTTTDSSMAPYLAMLKWLNQTSTKQALGVTNLTFSKGWKAYNALIDDEERSALMILSKVLSKIPVLLYNGNLDLVCNYLGTQAYANNLEWDGRLGYLNSKVNNYTINNKVVGTIQKYSKLTRLTIFGAGHISLYDQPMVTYTMLYRWLNNKF